MNLMNGWLWLVFALVLAALELALPTWFFLGAAIATGLVGLALLLGLWVGGLPMALVVTASLSGVIWYLLRRMTGVRKDQVRVWDRDINDND